MSIISDQRVYTTLNRLHDEASSEGFTIFKGLSKGVFRPLRPEDMKDAYLAISRDQGEYLYKLLLEKEFKNIVEFGTSFGISTLYLAIAARENGAKVITTELLPGKCRLAQQNFEEAGLAEWIDLREGDALETLKETPEQIDFLLMDGWNDLYLPLMELLEPRLKKGALIYADNASFPSAKPYLSYLRSKPEKYRSVRLQDAKGGSELTEVLK
ncbi:MAG: class I SAM-dependent methyltransferase [Bacteroidia bacterium]|nr:class I SAM-dependent methyltransferase [Bacteroidia bacterium]